MIRSTQTTLKFSNKGKLDKLHQFLDEYRSVVVQLIDLLWDLEKCPSLIPKNITEKITTWLSARAIQCAGKQAAGIVRGTKAKQSRRLYQINKFKKLGKKEEAKKLQKIYDSVKCSKPILKDINCELDERFVKIEFSKGFFDGWVVLGSLGNKLKIPIPFKKHKHFNKMLERGTIKKGIRLGRDSVTFIFDIKDVEPKIGQRTIGLDIGQKTTVSTSDGQLLDKCPHGHTYTSICEKLAKKQKGSKNFKRAVTHRSNYLRYIVNQINLDGVSAVNRENIKNLGKFSNVSRRMKHWNYRELFDVLDAKLIEQGVLVNKVPPAYTSQRCSKCGWTRKLNRNRKHFKCSKCSYESDADYNASVNLSFNLVPISEQERLQCKNKDGFLLERCG